MSGNDAFGFNRVAAYGYLIYDQQMGVRWCILAALVIGAGGTFAQKTKEIHGPMWAGPDVSPPRVLRNTQPTYSEEARKAQVQGTVFLRLIVDEKGHPTNITVVSPLGYGLDELAERAVAKWEFQPGKKNGKAVPVFAAIEVNFRLLRSEFNETLERQRTLFNVAAVDLKSEDLAARKRAVISVQDLAMAGFAPAQYAVGLWYMAGKNVEQNKATGISVLQDAASKNHGPALYELASRHMRGEDLPKDEAKGLDMMQRAASFGSENAQFYLASLYERGDGVAQDHDRARKYFRQCANKSVSMCQLRLGKLLLTLDRRSQHDYVEAIAWLELAGESGLSEGRETALREETTMPPSQLAGVRSLKAKLVKK